MSNLSAKDKIKDAFIQLVLEKGFEKTSVSAIVRLAEIHRSTFYDYYEDKFDLLAQLEEQVLAGMSAAFLNGEAHLAVADNDLHIQDSQYLSLLHYIKEEKLLIKALQTDSLVDVFSDKFEKAFDKIFEQSYRYHGLTYDQSDIVPEIYYATILNNAMTTTLWLWTSRDCLEDVHVIAHLIRQLENIDY